VSFVVDRLDFETGRYLLYRDQEKRSALLNTRRPCTPQLRADGRESVEVRGKAIEAQNEGEGGLCVW
jgi:hypothetical protein